MGKPNYSLGCNELKSKEYRLWESLIAEFLGNFLLNFFGVGACTQAFQDFTLRSLAFGLAPCVVITIIGHVSGGHINPTVTIALLVTGRISLLRAFLYLIMQLLGSIAGSMTMKILIADFYFNGLGHTRLAKGITELQGFGIEFFLGFVLMLTVFGTYDGYKPYSRFMAPIAVGMAVTLGHLGTVSITGASMNPARTLGTAIATNNWDSHWVYWAGPILGGIVGALIYMLVLEKPSRYKLAEKASRSLRDMVNRE